MDISAVAPDLRASVAALRRIDPARRLHRAAGRIAPRLIRWPRVDGVTIRNERIGGVRVRRYAPTKRTFPAQLLWIHGGGMVIGAPPMDDLLCSETAAELGITVTSVDYRHAPEHPFPAALDDCAAVWSALTIEDESPIAIGGQSAGGGIAASLAQRLIDEGGRQPVAQWLFSPMLDDRTAADRSLDGIEHFVWNNASNRIGWQAVLGREPGGTTTAPHAVPARRKNLSGLAPAWIGVGDIDLFHVEDVAYAQRLAAAGVDTTIRIVGGAPHGFESLAPQARTAQVFRAEARSWLASRLEGSAERGGTQG